MGTGERISARETQNKKPCTTELEFLMQVRMGSRALLLQPTGATGASCSIHETTDILWNLCNSYTVAPSETMVITHFSCYLWITL